MTSIIRLSFPPHHLRFSKTTFRVAHARYLSTDIRENMETLQKTVDQMMGKSANGYAQKDVTDLQGRVSILR